MPTAVRESIDAAPLAPRENSKSMSRPLRICHLAYTFFENDNRVLRYACTQQEAGHQVEVVALRRRGQQRSGTFRGIALTRIQRRDVTERRQSMYLVKLLAFLTRSCGLLGLRSLRRRYDVVHVHNIPDFLVFAALVPKLTGARVILDIHDVVPELYTGKFGGRDESFMYRCMLKVERLSCMFANHVIIANDLWRSKLVKRSVPAAKCSTILNYPDLDVFQPVPASEKSSDKFVLLYPGSLNRHQGLHVALRAFGHVVREIPNAEFHIYGEGPARGELEKLAAALGLKGVRLMDPLPIDRISRVMAAADVGIEPKVAEGFSNEALSTKIFEFLACEVPVVVSNTDAHRYYFDSSVVTFFRSGDETALAQAVIDTYRNRHRLAERLRKGREFAVLNSWQRRSIDYRQLVDSLLHTGGVPVASRSL